MGMKKSVVIDTINHIKTNIIPYNIELTIEMGEKICKYKGISKEDMNKWIDNYIDKASYNTGGYIKPGYYKDEFGVLWNRNNLDKDIGIIEKVLIDEDNIDSYSFPKPNIAQIETITKELVNNGKDTFKFGKIGMTYFERAWSLRGMENLLMDFILKPEFVKELFEKILDYNMQIIDEAVKYDIDGFYFGDDYGQQTGMLMSPDNWRQFIKPGLKKMFNRVKSAGKVVALHSCGNILEIFEDLIEIGLDIYQTFQPEVYDFKKVKEKFGKDITFWGGISTQSMLPFLSPNELTKEVNNIISIMASNGGYIVAPTHRVPRDVPEENIVRLVEFLKNQ